MCSTAVYHRIDIIYNFHLVVGDKYHMETYIPLLYHHVAMPILLLLQCELHKLCERLKNHENEF